MQKRCANQSGFAGTCESVPMKTFIIVYCSHLCTLGTLPGLCLGLVDLSFLGLFSCFILAYRIGCISACHIPLCMQCRSVCICLLCPVFILCKGTLCVFVCARACTRPCLALSAGSSPCPVSRLIFLCFPSFTWGLVALRLADGLTCCLGRCSAAGVLGLVLLSDCVLCVAILTFIFTPLLLAIFPAR